MCLLFYPVVLSLPFQFIEWTAVHNAPSVWPSVFSNEFPRLVSPLIKRKSDLQHLNKKVPSCLLDKRGHGFLLRPWNCFFCYHALEEKKFTLLIRHVHTSAPCSFISSPQPSTSCPWTMALHHTHPSARASWFSSHSQGQSRQERFTFCNEWYN